MAEEFYREACRRRHRVLGHFLAIQAWLRKLDCIVLRRRDLEHFLGLKRFKATRVSWLQEDLKPWFPFQTPYFKSQSPSSIHSLFIARVEMESHLPKGSMTTDLRIARMAKVAPKTETFILETATKLPLEDFIIAELALVSAGIKAPITYTKKDGK